MLFNVLDRPFAIAWPLVPQLYRKGFNDRTSEPGPSHPNKYIHCLVSLRLFLHLQKGAMFPTRGRVKTNTS